ELADPLPVVRGVRARLLGEIALGPPAGKELRLDEVIVVRRELRSRDRLIEKRETLADETVERIALARRGAAAARDGAQCFAYGLVVRHQQLGIAQVLHGPHSVAAAVL